MRKWALLVILFAIPLMAQEVDSARIKLLEDSIQSLNHRMEKIEEHWVEIKETADKSGEWARWLTIGGIGLAALILAALILYGITSTRRVERDLKEIKGKKEQVDAYIQFFKQAQEEATREAKGLREEREELKKKGETEKVKELDKKLAELSQRLETFQKMGLPLSANGWFERGNELYRTKRYLESLKAYDEAIRLKPDLAEAYDNRGVALGKLGRHEESLKAHDEAIRLKPDLAKAHNNRVATLVELAAKLIEEGKEEKAREKFKEAKKSAQKAIELSKGKEGYYNLACALVRLGELEEALGGLKSWKESGKEIPVDPWEDKDLAPLRKPPYRKRFIEIVGPPPEKEKKPKAKRKAKPKSTKPKKKK